MSREVVPVIRVADVSEVVAVAALRRAERGTADDPSFEARFEKWFLAEADRRITWVAELGDALVGCVSLFDYRRMPAPDRADSGWGYLSNMFVLTPYRGAGIGRMLLDAAIEAAEHRGYARVVLAPSIRSIPFYERVGFVHAGPDAGPDQLMVRGGGASS